MKHIWWILGSMCAFTQQPCGFYEIDGLPGQVNGDLGYRASLWTTSSAAVDLDNDGTVTILDFMGPISCLGDLNHGLLGKYYGFEDGSGNNISFPSFPVAFEASGIFATESFNDLDTGDIYSGRGFLETGFWSNFGAEYDGYLYVPETANYTLHFSGSDGVRLFLDGPMVLDYDSWPYEDEYTTNLTAGLHTLRVECFNGSPWGTIALDWSSDGSIIPVTGEIIDQRYLYHDSEVRPAYAATELKFIANPPTGSRVTSSTLNLDAFVLSADSDVHLSFEGMELALTEGRMQYDFNLQPGLNKLTFDLSDGSGLARTVDYHVYYDAESLTGPGLVANLYSTQFWNTPRPPIDNLFPFSQEVVPGPQINISPYNDQFMLGSTWLTGHVIGYVEGTINITQAGEYTFWNEVGGGVYINGEFLFGINETAARQWQNRGTVNLGVGRHHILLTMYGTWNSPALELEWSFEGGATATVPNSAFQYGPNHFHDTVIPKQRKSGGRVSGGLQLEYLLNAGSTLEDTSVYSGRDLYPDPRVIHRAPAGVTLEIGAGLTAEQGGVHAAQAIKQSGAFSLEADFTWEGPELPWARRDIVSLHAYSWTEYASLMIVADDLRFRFRDNNGDTHELSMDNFLDTYAGQRVHVVAGYNGSFGAITVNGVQVVSLSVNQPITQWANGMHAVIGHHINTQDDGAGTQDEVFHGTIHVAAIYSTMLNSSNANTNRTQNLILSPSPTDDITPVPVTFPPGGTSQSDLDEAHHILSRMTFGPSAGDINHIVNIGVSAWIAEQLNPQAIDDSELDQYLTSGVFKPEYSGTDFVSDAMYRAIKSNRQLLEVMTQFWENHFNTQLSKVEELREEYKEHNLFRENALGNFRDLVMVSALNTPMTIYLDSEDNRVGNANENYAREIMELHCLGVNNGYDQDDIVGVAKCFTGWAASRNTGQLDFRPWHHDFGPKSFGITGLNVPAGGGMSDGIAVIDHLINMTECADFISWKLCQLFVGDDPPADVVAAASSAFQGSNGDITVTLQAIFNHARFRTDTAYRGNKIRTPLEFVAAAVRAVDAHPVPHSLYPWIDRMGMQLFEYPFPTGFEESGEYWINTNSLLERWNFLHYITSTRGNGSGTAVNMDRFIPTYVTSLAGAPAATDISDFFQDLTSHGTEAATVYTQLYNFMTNNDPGSFVVDDASLDQAIRHTLSIYLRLPEFNVQ